LKTLKVFFKTSLLGGLFVLLPLVLFYLMLDQLLGVMVALATPIADLFPPGTFDEVRMPVIIAVILIMGASFLFGLALRVAVLRQFGRWFEYKMLGRLPLYNAVKSLARGLLGTQENTAFQSAVLHSPDGEREIVYVIEDDGEGEVTVLVPWAPASFAGSVKIVAGDRVEILEASVGDASRVLSHWGMGANKLLGKKAAADS